MKVAVIDLGTNTFNLLIVQFEESNFRTIIKEKISVKLGEGGINIGKIQKAAFDRGIAAIGVYMQLIKKHKAELVFAFATNAVRSASNGEEFKNVVDETYGISVQIIDGDEEARLIYKGVCLGVPLGDEKSLIMDIGGGSTEFIIANKKEIFWQKSYHLGAARLVEKFNHSEPILSSEIDSIKNYLKENCKELQLAMQKHQVKNLIGSSGSFETLADIVSYAKHNKSIFETEFTFIEINKNQLIEVINQLYQLDVEQRLKVKGMIPLRVDMIIVASLFIEFIIKQFNIEKVILSDYALKEGILDEVMNGNIK